jgi:hypothetical protein
LEDEKKNNGRKNGTVLAKGPSRRDVVEGIESTLFDFVTQWNTSNKARPWQLRFTFLSFPFCGLETPAAPVRTQEETSPHNVWNNDEIFYFFGAQHPQ